MEGFQRHRSAFPYPCHVLREDRAVTIGSISGTVNERSSFARWAAAFVAGLRDLGWIEGRTIVIEYRWSEGRPERYAEIAAEFVRLPLLMSYCRHGWNCRPLSKAGDVDDFDCIAVAIDPVGAGRVPSRGKPGGHLNPAFRSRRTNLPESDDNFVRA